MPDQLEDLKRQRALVAEHLAWLDRRIAMEAALSPASPSLPTSDPVVAPAPAGAADGKNVVPPPVAGGSPSPESDTLFARFAAEERPALRPPSKFGCWLGFSLILVVVIGGVIAIIYQAYR